MTIRAERSLRSDEWSRQSGEALSVVSCVWAGARDGGPDA